MGARLVATVHIKDPATHQMIRLNPGDEPTPEQAALITNPDAWEDGRLPSDQGDKQADRKPAAPKPARSRKAADTTGDGGQ